MQFVVWTIVGVAAFLSLTFLADPAMIQSLPSVPQGFLLLMSVSSAGYLGGKIARKPGPVIFTAKGAWEVESTRVGSARADNLTFSIIGQSLAVDCGLRFNGMKVHYVKASDAKPTDNVLELVNRDPNATDDTIASELRLTVRDGSLIDKIVAMQSPKPNAPVAGAGSAGAGAAETSAAPTTKPEISVTNPDGQMAAWPVVIEAKTRVASAAPQP